MLKFFMRFFCPEMSESNSHNEDYERENPFNLKIIEGEGKAFFSKCGHHGPLHFEIHGTQPFDERAIFSFSPDEVENGVISSKECPCCYFKKLAAHATFCDSCLGIILPGTSVRSRKKSQNAILIDRDNSSSDLWNHEVFCSRDSCKEVSRDSSFEAGLWTLQGFVSTDDCLLQM